MLYIMEIQYENAVMKVDLIRDISEFTDYALFHPILESLVMEMYDEWINESFGVVDICGLKYESARAIKSVDETAYRVMLSDYMNYVEEYIYDELSRTDYVVIEHGKLKVEFGACPL